MNTLRIISIVLGLGYLATPLQAQAETLLTKQVPVLQSSEQYLPTTSLVNRIELSLTQRKVSLYQGETLIQQYPVGVGRPGWETPVGTFEVKTMIVNPAWKHPFNGTVIPSGDPENPLGKRWIGFWTDGNNWVGFHGTSNSMRPSIGTAASHGCVRMFDEDIQSMFELVAVGTPILVTP